MRQSRHITQILQKHVTKWRKNILTPLGLFEAMFSWMRLGSVQINTKLFWVKTTVLWLLLFIVTVAQCKLIGFWKKRWDWFWFFSVFSSRHRSYIHPCFRSATLASSFWVTPSVLGSPPKMFEWQYLGSWLEAQITSAVSTRFLSRISVPNSSTVNMV